MLGFFVPGEAKRVKAGLAFNQEAPVILGVIKERGGMRERRRLVLRGEPSRRSPLLREETERSKQAPLMNPASRFSVFTPCKVSQEAKRSGSHAGGRHAGPLP